MSVVNQVEQGRKNCGGKFKSISEEAATDVRAVVRVWGNRIPLAVWNSPTNGKNHDLQAGPPVARALAAIASMPLVRSSDSSGCCHQRRRHERCHDWADPSERTRTKETGSECATGQLRQSRPFDAPGDREHVDADDCERGIVRHPGAYADSPASRMRPPPYRSRQDRLVSNGFFVRDFSKSVRPLTNETGHSTEDEQSGATPRVQIVLKVFGIR